jgi:hypothetical protein
VLLEVGNENTYSVSYKKSVFEGLKLTSFMFYLSQNIESFIYPNNAQLDCSKNVKIYIKIYKRGALTCFGFSQPSTKSYCMCFAKVISINNQLKYVVLHSFVCWASIIFTVVQCILIL